jgi:hypothetical protein
MPQSWKEMRAMQASSALRQGVPVNSASPGNVRGPSSEQIAYRTGPVSDDAEGESARVCRTKAYWPGSTKVLVDNFWNAVILQLLNH